MQRQPTPQADLSTPDGTVLAYIQAYRTGSQSDIRSFYAQHVIQDLDRRNASGILQQPPGRPVTPGETQRIQIVGTKIDGDRATVTLSLTTFRVDSPVSPSEYTYQTSVSLVREGGRWKLDGEFYPG